MKILLFILLAQMALFISQGVKHAFADTIVAENVTYWGNILEVGGNELRFDFKCSGEILIFKVQEVESFNITSGDGEGDCYPFDGEHAGDGGFFESILFCEAYASPRTRKWRNGGKFYVVVQSEFNFQENELVKENIYFFDKLKISGGRPVGYRGAFRKKIRKPKHHETLDAWQTSHNEVMGFSGNQEEDCSQLCGDGYAEDYLTERHREGFCSRAPE